MKVVVLGGGTGASTLLRGLKLFPLDITAVISVADDGRSTGKLRKEFHTIAVGDIRQVITALSDNEPLFEKLMNYRFQTTSDLNGHPVGNLLLTALISINGDMSTGIESLSKVFNLKGRVLPLTEESVTLKAKMNDNSFVVGEHHITESHKGIKQMYYTNKVHTNPLVLEAIKDTDLIILSMGSLYTSLIPNLIPSDIKKAIKESKAKIMYVCNMMTQPGETDNFKASDHIKVINGYLKRDVDIIAVNDGDIEKSIIDKYKTEEQKDIVVFDEEQLKKLNLEIIHNNYVDTSSGSLRHKVDKLSLDIYGYLIDHIK